MVTLNSGERVIGHINMTMNGGGYLVAKDSGLKYFINKYNIGKALHLDEVEITSNGTSTYVTRIIKRNKLEFVGTLRLSKNGGVFEADSSKMLTNILIPNGECLNAKDGDKVMVKLGSWKKKEPSGSVIKVLGDPSNTTTIRHCILEDNGLPYNFDEHVSDEADIFTEEIPQSEINSRLDFRDILTFTIDPENSRDFDDALSFEKTDTGYRIGVHIADVSHYVRPDSALDKEAFKRGTSVYLVDTVVPMLPENLSNNICSLVPNRDRLAFSVIFYIDDDANIISYEFHKVIINSNKRFTYESAQEILDSNGLFCDHKYFEALTWLNKTAKILRERRSLAGGVILDKQEYGFELDSNNFPIARKIKKIQDTNRLIEEFMLLANKHVAIKLKSHLPYSINRVHSSPDLAKLNTLKNYVENLGFTLDLNDEDNIRVELNKLLDKIKVESPENFNIINSLVVKTMQKAIYSTKDIGHYGLGFQDYTHFTSAIRRYSDVISHRLLHKVLIGKKVIGEAKLTQYCNYLSEMEKRAQKAEFDSIKYMETLFMSDKIGKVFNGVIVSIIESGMFVNIIEHQCTGFLPISKISSDYYSVSVDKYHVTNETNGHRFGLGDTIFIKVDSVNTQKRMITLSGI
jgi:ribonuclease R